MEDVYPVVNIVDLEGRGVDPSGWLRVGKFGLGEGGLAPPPLIVDIAVRSCVRISRGLCMCQDPSLRLDGGGRWQVRASDTFVTYRKPLLTITGEGSILRTGIAVPLWDAVVELLQP